MNEDHFIQLGFIDQSNVINSLFKSEHQREIARDSFVERVSILTADGTDEESARQIAALEVISLIGRI